MSLIRKEDFYQKILEKQLDGKHMYLSTGITDITTDEFHAEIKCWCNWKDVVKQLMLYNVVEPRNELRAYFFGEARESLKQLAFECLTKLNIEVYVIFDIENDEDNVILRKFNENDFMNELIENIVSIGGMHICPRCGYKTSNVCHFKKHITRKNICKPKVQDINLDDTIKKYFTPVTQSNECPKCMKMFSTPYSMKNHLKKCTVTSLAPLTNIKPIPSETEENLIKFLNLI